MPKLKDTKRYFVDMCIPHPRVFVDNPPSLPKGRVIEVTPEQLGQLELYPRTTWAYDGESIIVSKLKIRPSYLIRHNRLLFLYGHISGIILGVLIGLLF